MASGAPALSPLRLQKFLRLARALRMQSSATFFEVSYADGGTETRREPG